MVDVASIGNSVMGVVMLIMGVIVLGIIAVLVIKIIESRRKYMQYKCVILTGDGFNKPNLEFDNAGIFIDNKTNNKRLYLKKNNVGLDPDDIPYIRGEKKKYIFLARTGLKNFRYLHSFNKIFEKKKFGLFGGEPEVGEEDVNWAINSYERAKKVFGTSTLEKLLPYLGLILMGVFMLGMIAVIIQKMPILIDKMTELSRHLELIAQAQSGTTVLQ